MDLYCLRHKVPNDQEKILTANLHMKGKAPMWMQPYVENYLRSATAANMKPDTQSLFASWSNFKEGIKRIFREVDAENQAEKTIARLKQTNVRCGTERKKKVVVLRELQRAIIYTTR